MAALAPDPPHGLSLSRDPTGQSRVEHLFGGVGASHRAESRGCPLRFAKRLSLFRVTVMERQRRTIAESGYRGSVPLWAGRGVAAVPSTAGEELAAVTSCPANQRLSFSPGFFFQSSLARAFLVNGGMLRSTTSPQRGEETTRMWCPGHCGKAAAGKNVRRWSVQAYCISGLVRRPEASAHFISAFTVD
ncbi:hypothetical protein MTO96_011881 [Rhipicephalus appendiculatus]